MSVRSSFKSTVTVCLLFTKIDTNKKTVFKIFTCIPSAEIRRRLCRGTQFSEAAKLPKSISSADAVIC